MPAGAGVGAAAPRRIGGRTQLVCRPRLRARGGAAVAFGRRSSPMSLVWPTQGAGGLALAPVGRWRYMQRAWPLSASHPRNFFIYWRASLRGALAHTIPPLDRSGAAPFRGRTLTCASAAACGLRPDVRFADVGQGTKIRWPCLPASGETGLPKELPSMPLTSAAFYCIRRADRSQPARG